MFQCRSVSWGFPILIFILFIHLKLLIKETNLINYKKNPETYKPQLGGGDTYWEPGSQFNKIMYRKLFYKLQHYRSVVIIKSRWSIVKSKAEHLFHGRPWLLSLCLSLCPHSTSNLSANSLNFVSKCVKAVVMITLPH